jgi:succinate dehydrogenase/fumarate reductase flavoprotein subunit
VRKGVILATGGFPHDPTRQKGHFSHIDKRPHASAAPETNTGDGLRVAEKVGAKIDMNLAQPAAWAPVSLVPDGTGGFRNFQHLIDRAKPGFVAVTTCGKRFVNEANSYHEFMKALFAITPEHKAPEAWLICDHKAQRKFGIGWAKPFPFPLRPYLRSGYLKRGRTLRELAVQCDLPAETLEQTIMVFNTHARDGHDPEFNRGATRYNRASGWGKHKGSNPTLAPLENGPFYAVRLVPGSLGTFAGIRTGADGQVLSQNDTPIGGLYAVGNDAASIMGGHYPSGGITLGPGMTFGYVTARRLAGLPVKGLSETPQHVGMQRKET